MLALGFVNPFPPNSGRVLPSNAPGAALAVSPCAIQLTGKRRGLLMGKPRGSTITECCPHALQERRSDRLTRLDLGRI